MTSLRVGLFGGSFNPPHVGHLMAALYVLETSPIDALWLAPTFRHAFGKELASYEDRVAMCALAADALGPRVQVSRVEEEVARLRGGESRTLYMLEQLAATHTDHAFRLIIGADILAETAKWHRWDEVCRRAPPIVVGRGGATPPAGVSVLPVVIPSVSSTEVRHGLAAGEDVSGLVPRTVLGYIDRRGLYR